MPRSAAFHIQHMGGRFIHPKGGLWWHEHDNPREGWLVTYDGTGSQTPFYFEFVEGRWGYLVWSCYPLFCVHPGGGELNPGNNAALQLHTDRHRAALFRYNIDTQTFQHIGGRYWHPRGGMADPDNDNRVLLYEGYRDETKFRLTDAGGKPISLDSFGQDGWHRCGRCGVLHYSKSTSRCPATQGPHQPEGDNHAFFPQPENAGADWRWCKKCGTLHCGRGATVCPAGSAHDQTGSGNYAVQMSAGDWRWCNKCGALHSGTASVCPAGGAHASAGSGSYSLQGQRETSPRH